MPERHALVGSKVGLHARPAALFVQAVSRQPVKVTIAKPGAKPVPANSILSVLALDARGGDEVVLAAEGEGSDAALDELVSLIASDFDADTQPDADADTQPEQEPEPEQERAH